MRKVKKFVIAGALILLIFCIYAFCLYNGILQINNPSQKKYPVRGVDVSSYQGDIDWNLLSDQSIDFAFIKATEGSSYVDRNFYDNWENASETNLKISAYHFFSYHSSGASQAEHFINTIPYNENALAPVVDIEFYGDLAGNPLPASEVVPEIESMLIILENYYGVKPILYFTQNSYELYIKGNFDDYPLWARSVYGKLDYIDSSGWVLWQYSNRKKLKGYNGTENFIDMNCFNGSAEDFAEFCTVNLIKPKADDQPDS